MHSEKTSKMTRVSDRDQFLNNFKRNVNDCVRFATTHLRNTDVQNDILIRFSTLRQDLRYASAGQLITEEEFHALTSAVDRLNTLITQQIGQFSADTQGPNTDNEQTEGYTSKRIQNGKRGAPKLDITLPQLEFLMACRFTQTKMAELMGVSTKTISRRLRQFQLNATKYSDISDCDLDEVISKLLSGNQRIGANSVVTRLENRGLKVQREKVRRAVRRVDPAGVACRSQQRLKRRTYKVHGPNSLWHLDGNHKLIRWRIVIHAAIDGYSRMITYMKASTNNRSSTVLALFKEACAEYGVPSRIRCDNGGENTAVCEHMENYRGTGRGSAIRGRSVHNQRIERNWLDMWNGCVNVYYDLFTTLEEEDRLDPNDEGQMFALHYVYLPHINDALSKFVLQWNHHKMRTENSMSPVQLFVQRALALQGSSSTAAQEMWNSAEPQDDATQSHSEDEREDSQLSLVTVPSTIMPITDDQYEDLCGRIDPRNAFESDSLGVDLYLQVLDFMRHITE